MVLSSIVDYCNGLLISKYPKRKKIFLIFSIIFNLSLLGFFKYFDFFVTALNIGIDPLGLPLPIGISFYTFQTMSYSIDVYNGKVKPEKNFLNFMTYVSMFPQLIAGPIVRYETISNELKSRKEDVAAGFIRFLEGLFKKVLIANNCGYLFTVVTSMPYNEISKLLSLLAILAFSIQIFFDFSGYSDMAIGIGKMLGFNYPENFNYPYIATSITDFWRRWHMSLSSFFKDYVYIPLGGSRVSTLKNIRNIFVVWLLTGLWHGASFNFIIWGVYYGVLLLLEKFVLKNLIAKLPKFMKHIYTLIFVFIGWYIFAFDNFLDFGKILFSSNKFIDANFLAFSSYNFSFSLKVASVTFLAASISAS
jgi:alginate O-acetyltransferase complex protein AlgI